MELVLPVCTVRGWRQEDAPSLVEHADNRKIWRNLRDGFPHPYTLERAEAWLQTACAQQPTTAFAVEVDGAAVGGIGLHPGQDVARRSAEIGFWLGEAYWGRGIASAAVAAVTEYGLTTLELLRIHATVYEWNPASARVLEKAGYALEGRLRKAAIKDGQVIDTLLYAIVR